MGFASSICKTCIPLRKAMGMSPLKVVYRVDLLSPLDLTFKAMDEKAKCGGKQKG